jgi:hypothetical protein
LQYLGSRKGSWMAAETAGIHVLQLLEDAGAALGRYAQLPIDNDRVFMSARSEHRPW